jgi:hypothetical protein
MKINFIFCKGKFSLVLLGIFKHHSNLGAA